jgi:response regulator RpfG family c-di-GMP phosphodiesterase
MATVLNSGIEQYRLVTAEREILEQTLNGSINMLTEILSLFHPELFGRSTQIRDLIRKLSKSLNIRTSWDMEAASMLSQIGFLGLPPEVLLKAQDGKTLSKEEKEIYTLVPEIGGHLLVNIPRLSSVSNIVLYQNKHFDGSGFPDNSMKEQDIPLGARIIKILFDLLELEETGVSRNKAIEQLKERKGWYDPKVLNKVATIFWQEEEAEQAPTNPYISVSLKDLRVGDIIRSDIQNVDGMLLLKNGQSLSMVQLARLKNCAKIQTITEPIQVEKPETPPEDNWSQV